MGYFNQDSFASNLILAEQVIVAGLFTSGPIDCTGYQGVRAKFINDAGFSRCNIVFTWYDDQAQAAAATAFNLAGQRSMVLDTGQEACFSAAHLGDWLVINIGSQDAGNFSLHTAVAHRQNPARQWMPGSSLLIAFPTTSLAAGTQIPVTALLNRQGLYAGPVGITVQGPSAAGGWQLLLQAADSTGNFDTVYDTGLLVNTLGVTAVCYVPPAPLRLDFHNLTGAAGNFTCNVVADDWRD